MEWCSRLEIRHNSLEKGIFVSICCDDESNKVNARATIKRIVLFVSYESFLFCTAKLWKEDEKALNEAWKLSVKGEGIIENRVHKNSLQFLLTKSKRISPDTRHTIWYSHGGKDTTISERRFPDTCHTVGDRDGGKV